MPSVPSGINGIPTNTIPSDPAEFVTWFKTNFLPRWAGNADIRNAVSGAGISITGNIGTPATVAVNADLQALFAQPYVLVGSPVAPAPLTDYRSISAQNGVLTITDGGAESLVTVGVATNGIGDAQIRQSAATSVIGNATGATANVADIVASADGQVLTMAGGLLGFGTLSATSLAAIANDTVLGNVAGSPAAPAALSTAQLTTLVNLATASLSGAIPALSETSTQYLNGIGAWATPAYPTGANPSSTVGLSAVDGSAVTFMTSDSAPALSQAIAPTWTEAHIFTPGSAVTAITVNSASGQTGVLVNATATTKQADIVFQQDGVTTAEMGTDGGNALYTLSANGDFVIRMASGKNLWVVMGAAEALNITSAGAATFADAVTVKGLMTASDGLTVTGAVAVSTTLGVTGAATLSSTLSVTGDVGFFGVTPSAQSTGWGTPTNNSQLTNFPGSSATLAECGAFISELILTLKNYGLMGA